MPDFDALMIAHAKEAKPKEACGIIAGRDGVRTKLYRARNAAKGNAGFIVHPDDLLRILREIKDEGGVIDTIYHSHPRTEAYPSDIDVKLAFWSSARYAIVSLADVPTVRTFRIIGGVVTEEVPCLSS